MKREYVCNFANVIEQKCLSLGDFNGPHATPRPPTPHPIHEEEGEEEEEGDQEEEEAEN